MARVWCLSSANSWTKKLPFQLKISKSKPMRNHWLRLLKKALCFHSQLELKPTTLKPRAKNPSRTVRYSEQSTTDNLSNFEIQNRSQLFKTAVNFLTPMGGERCQNTFLGVPMSLWRVGTLI